MPFVLRRGVAHTLCLAATTAACVVALAPAAGAATIAVDTTADAGPDGRCSLREAVLAAATDRAVDSCPAGGSADVIVLPAQQSAYSLAQGPLELSGRVTLRGAGVVDAGTPDAAAVHVLAGGTVTLSGLTLRGGVSGVLVNDGVLRLVDVAVRDSSSLADPPVAAGITNRGTASVLRTTVTAVTGAPGGTSALYNAAGAHATVRSSTLSGNSSFSTTAGTSATVDNEGQLAIDRTDISRNAGVGLVNAGDLQMSAGTVNQDEVGVDNRGSAAVTGSSVTGSTVVGVLNRATGRVSMDGSAISGNGPSSDLAVAGGVENDGDLRLSHSAVTGNAGVGTGGVLSSGTLLLENVTVAKNTARSWQGIDFRDGAGGVTVAGGAASLRNVTLAGNAYAAGPRGDAPRPRAAGNLALLAGSVQLADSVLAYGRQDQGPAAGGEDCTGAVTSLGYNLVRQAGGCGTAGPGDITGRDPLLAPLTGSGPLAARPPSPQSPLVDGGSPATPGSGQQAACAADDQRRAPRPRDGDGDGTARCDIGAIER